MKAMVYENYGGPEVLKLENLPKPVPGDNDLLVRVKATSLNKADQYMLTGKPGMSRLMGNGLLRPKHKIMGTDFSGVVEAAGKQVTAYQPGDRVFGDLSGSGFGAFGEYVCVSTGVISLMPKELSFEEAATLSLSGCTALKAVRDTISIKPKSAVLVNGASGCVGSFVIQLLKAYDVTITGTCSTDKVELVKKLGADHVINYRKEDFLKSGKRYDVIIDTAIQQPVMNYRNSLTQKGAHIVIGGSIPKLFQAMFLSPFVTKKGGRKLKAINSVAKSQALSDLAAMVNEGTLKPVIDRTYPLEASAEAMTYFMSHKACGKVVITI